MNGQEFIEFRGKWDSCFESSPEERKAILEDMSDKELEHFSWDKGSSRQEQIQEHLDFFAREMGETEDDSEDEMDF